MLQKSAAFTGLIVLWLFPTQLKKYLRITAIPMRYNNWEILLEVRNAMHNKILPANYCVD